MNLLHRIVCKSAMWKRSLKEDIFPWALGGVWLGDNILEIGPGSGLTTDLLRNAVVRMTAIEKDPSLAASLSRRLAGTNVTVVQQDATAMSFPGESFDDAVCMTMLHHIPSATLQDALFAEVARVLRPGGVFIGCDRLFRSRFDITHLFDTKVPVLPDTLPARLRASGFEQIHVEARRHDFKFRATKSLARHPGIR